MAPAATPTHLTVRLLELPTRAVLSAAHNRTPDDVRILAVVALHAEGDLQRVIGWGECSALNQIGYTNESSETAFELLRSGEPIDAAVHPMASAALEMARLDAELRAAGQSLADRLGTSNQSAVAGAVVGAAAIPTMLAQVDELAEAGFERVKCKVLPGRLIEPLRAIRQSFPELELHADANASLRAEDLPTVVALRDLGVTAIEQPFAVADRHSAARLVGESDLTVIADEAIAQPGDIDAIAADGAATAVAIKPPKLGGLAVALEALDRASVTGLRASLGGMLESGLGRHLLAAAAPLPIFTVVGDLSPAARWLADDPFPDITMTNGRIEAPSTPGIAGDPDLDKLAHYTVRSAVVALART